MKGEHTVRTLQCEVCSFQIKKISLKVQYQRKYQQSPVNVKYIKETMVKEMDQHIIDEHYSSFQDHKLKKTTMRRLEAMLKTQNPEMTQEMTPQEMTPFYVGNDQVDNPNQALHETPQEMTTNENSQKDVLNKTDLPQEHSEQTTKNSGNSCTGGITDAEIEPVEKQEQQKPSNSQAKVPNKTIVLYENAQPIRLIYVNSLNDVGLPETLEKKNRKKPQSIRKINYAKTAKIMPKLRKLN